MADPILRGEWLNPIGVKLTFDYASAGDFEIWWKDSTPQNQNYRILGVTSSDYFDVTPLNWSTLYYFKVRAILGTTYSGFSNEITLFCSCNQVFISGAPPEDVAGGPGGGPPLVTQFWQQAADPYNGDIAFSFKDFSHTALWIFERTKYFDALDPSTELENWLFRGASGYQTPDPDDLGFVNTGAFYPAATRVVDGQIATIDLVEFDNPNFGWYMLRFWDGGYLRTSLLGPNPWENYPSTYRSREPSWRSLPYCMEFDGANRIVVLQYWQDWDGDVDPNYGTVLTITVSEDRGFSWSSEKVIAFGTDTDFGFQATLAVDGNGNYWITMTEWTFPWGPTWALPFSVFVVYRIYKYTVGSGAILKRTIESKLTNTWGPPPFYTQLTFDVWTKSAVITAEGNKIAIAYVNDFDVQGGAYPSYYGVAEIKVDISTDGGNGWSTKTVSVPGKSIFWVNDWASTIPAITISNGNLIMFLVVGTTSIEGYRIIKSTDNGNSWSIVYDFGAVSLEYPWVSQLRSDGDYVTFTGCKAGITAGGSLALWESKDGGDNWTPEEVIPATPTVVLSAEG